MTKQLTPIQSLAGHIEKRAGTYEQMLRAKGVDIARFKQNALVAASENEDIANGNVSADSVLKVCSRAASDGVVLDGKEAAIVIGSVKKGSQWVKQAQYRLMVGGVMKMITRSPNLKRAIVQLVHENDVCTIDLVSDGVPINHTIDLKQERGEIIGAYALAELNDGSYTSPEYMTTAQINAVREGYSSDKSPLWNKSWGEAARKTVLHRAKKRWPIESDIEVSLRDDEKGEDITIIENEATPKPKKKTSVKDAVKAKMQEAVEPPKHDAKTGEIEDAEFEEIPADAPAEDDNNDMPI